MSSEVPEEEQRVTYSSSLLFGKSPLEAMEILKMRHSQVRSINHELAEWFTAYGRLRLRYVDELKKLLVTGEDLFTNLQNPKLYNEKIDSLGLASPMWSSVLKVVGDEAELFDQSTRKMGKHMIAPLKLYIRQHESDLVEMDDLCTLAGNIAKKEKKGEDTSILTNEWSQRAPYFFEIFENYDFERLILMKDVFTKYETDLTDVLETFREDNETGIEHVLSFSPNDEIKRYADAALSKEISIDIIKSVNDIKPGSSKATASQSFTSSAANSHKGNSKQVTSSPSKHSHRLSLLPSHKKTTQSTLVPPGVGSSSRRTSTASNATNTSSFSSTPKANDKKHKEKGNLRSRFGTMLGRKKKDKKSDLHNSTIAESETSSLASAPSRNDQLTRSNTAGSRDKLKEVPQPVQPPITPKPLEPEQQQQSSISGPLNKSLAPPPIAKTSTVEPPKLEGTSPGTEELYSEPRAVNGGLSTNGNLQSQSATSVAQSGSSSFYPTMMPTRRTNSMVSSNDESSIQPSIRNSSTAPTSDSPVVAKEPSTPSIPEPVVAPQVVSSPPPPPSSRKHISTDNSTPNNRESHGTVPAPPQQRKSMLVQQNSAAPVSSNGPAPVTSPIAAASLRTLPTPEATPISPPVLVTPPQHKQPQAAAQPITSHPTGSSLQPQGTGSTMLSRNATGNGGLVNGQISHPSLTTPGLNASVVELFNASFKDGKVSRSNAIGEVAFSYILDESVKRVPSKIDLNVVSRSGQALPSFMCNPLVLTQSQVDPNTFTITDPSQIYLRTVGGLKYMLNNPIPPIIVQPIWKHEQNQSTVIISIKPSEELSTFLTTNTLTLSNFVVSVSTAGALATSAATKPSGSFNREKNRVTWNLSSTPIVFSNDNVEERLIARFMTTGLSRESDAGVQLRFAINSDDGALGVISLNSDLEIAANVKKTVEDPFSSKEAFEDDSFNNDNDGDSEWKVVPTLKTIVAGGYSGHS